MSYAEDKYIPEQADALQARYLESISEQVRELVDGWEEVEPDTRVAVLAERDDLIEHADVIAQRDPESVTTDVSAAYREAQAKWREVRAAFKSL